MARYGQEFKDRAVARLPPQESASVDVVSRTPQDLENWKVAATQALASPGELGTPRLAKQERRRIKELERELRRKDKALPEVAALLVL